ncbi:Undecaprenyl-phosphate glucose phosphotransferase [Paraburkholderia bannensis]|uniref:Undecaprenyl-phosphate glucose phosphotransferase n=1 Tax=Paraburkholderia bannensis TaxID=765414 RepID=A0A7W9TT48_9BURK|nr:MULTISPECIES: undecaprenyl-phosphate glucose phosphotransferase [Paraburkholderia]MBB3255229.1 Undecaprenyl-phosphate glucose phosphotransferase [Paraburkholderia sp. WP4_3_2]MBB6100759.1 Undecaprenyl-phosphate glucose phosphotransferase [Paraburkholderia bannensis]
MLARLSDSVAIAGGALITARAPGVTDGMGYNSALVAFAMLMVLMLFPSWGMYRVTRTHLFWRCVCAPVFGWLFALTASCLLVFALHRTYRPSGEWLREWAAFSAAGIVFSRLAAHAICLSLARHDIRVRAVAVVGTAAHCRELIRKLGTTSDSVYRVTAVFDAADQPHAIPLGLPTFSDRDAFAAYVRHSRIDELWLAVPLSEGKTIVPFVELFRNDLINTRFIPDVSGLSVFGAGMANIEGTSAINLIASPIASYSLIGKEIFDRVFALFALLVLAPVLIAIAGAVKCSSAGPVFFKQRRKGANGKVFSIYKFRSMRAHAERTGLVKQATRNDPRVTRVGAFLRRTSLDELPQFFNVLRGDMSVVGPRPHAIEHDVIYQDIVDGYIHRYRIKPGITGWAQVNGFRGETDHIEKMQGRVAHDLYYLSNWSFWFDMRIVVATIFNGLVHRNAY